MDDAAAIPDPAFAPSLFDETAARGERVFRHEPDPLRRRQVEAMAAYGIPDTAIARVLGIDPATLRVHYPDELATGGTKANSKVAESLYRKAIGDGHQSVTAAIFWLKTRARWKETSIHELGGLDGEPLGPQISVIVTGVVRAGDGEVDAQKAFRDPP